jgi:hypothetical protein
MSSPSVPPWPPPINVKMAVPGNRREKVFQAPAKSGTVSALTIASDHQSAIRNWRDIANSKTESISLAWQKR